MSTLVHGDLTERHVGKLRKRGRCVTAVVRHLVGSRVPVFQMVLRVSQENGGEHARQ